jgi:hypothetical protein
LTTALSTREGLPSSEASARVLRIQLPSLNSLLAIGIVVFAVVWRAWAMLQWTFQMQDWMYVSDAARLPFLTFITKTYFGHVQPGQLTLVWVVTKVAPLDYVVAVFPLLIVSLVGGLLMWRFLRALFGDRPANLIPLAVFMLCPLTLSPALWWTTALALIPQQAFIVAALFAALLYVREPSRRRLIVLGLAYVGGLLFWQKALLILPILVPFVLLYLGEGTGRVRMRNVSLGLWKMWAMLGLITATYMAWYLTVAEWQFGNHPTMSRVWRLTSIIFRYNIAPTYLGGPWSVPRHPVWNLELRQLPSLPLFLTWVAFGAIVGVSLVVRRQAWRAWTLPLTYIGSCIVLVAAARLNSWVGPLVGLDARYVADSVPVFALALGLAFLVPLERRRDPMWARRVIVIDVEAERSSEGSQRHRDDAATWRRAWPTPRRFALAIVLIYAVSSLITGTRMAGLADAGSEKEWIATVKSEVASHPGASILDGHLPPNVLPAFWFPQAARLSRALGPIASGIRWDAPAEHILSFDATGHLRPVEVAHTSLIAPGPTRGCGYLVSRAPLTIPLDRARPAWRWGVQLLYFTNADADGYVTVDGDRQRVRFLRGPHSLTLTHFGKATSVTIQAGGYPVCVGSTWVGLLGIAGSGG